MFFSSRVPGAVSSLHHRGTAGRSRTRRRPGHARSEGEKRSSARVPRGGRSEAMTHIRSDTNWNPPKEGVNHRRRSGPTPTLVLLDSTPRPDPHPTGRHLPLLPTSAPARPPSSLTLTQHKKVDPVSTVPGKKCCSHILHVVVQSLVRMHRPIAPDETRE